MLNDFTQADGSAKKIPYDWTLFYLRKKALTQKIKKEELAWILLNFNQNEGTINYGKKRLKNQHPRHGYILTAKQSQTSLIQEKLTKD